jgi:hypothetical protein
MPFWLSGLARMGTTAKAARAAKRDGVGRTRMPAGKSKQRWKQAEREVSGALGTQRLANNGFGQPDLVVPARDGRPPIAVQCKTKAAIPSWFTDALSQATLDASSVGEGAVPAVVIIHAPGSGIKKQRYVILRFEDAVNLLAGDKT